MAASHRELESVSDSDPEIETSLRCSHRHLSTTDNISNTNCLKEGFLYKQSIPFQRWSRCYFRIKPHKLYYAKNCTSSIFSEVELVDSCIAECSMKNINHSFQVITQFRSLSLCADSRKEMEEWIAAIRTATSTHNSQVRSDAEEVLSAGHHHWCAFPHVRPIYCNVCREALSGVTRAGVTLNGLSCEVCKFKVHKRCAVKVTTACKWTTLVSIGDDVIEEDNGNITMPHQWIEGNLPVNSKCCHCEKTCGSIRRLQDYWCLWCHCTTHSQCRGLISKACSLGQCRVSVLPPTAITSLDSDGFWRATKPPGTSPLLVFLNSKSGDNQGVKMLWKFKQLLNPAQVFDLVNGGPKMGLRLFQNFESFRVLVCGGDGSIGWVLTEIDKLGLHNQCQVGVLPLGTGNDLSRVLGWGPTFDDDTQLPAVLEQLEHAQIKMLDRWSIYSHESSLLGSRRFSTNCDPISAYEDSVANHLSRILHSDSYNVVISSATVLCSTVKELVAKVASSRDEVDESISCKCTVLNEKLDALLKTLQEESQTASEQMLAAANVRLSVNNVQPPLATSPTNSTTSTTTTAAAAAAAAAASANTDVTSNETAACCENVSKCAIEKHSQLDSIAGSPPETTEFLAEIPTKTHRHHRKARRPTVFRPREQLMSRANSLKKAIRQIIEHTEKAIDEQNSQTLQFEMENIARQHCSLLADPLLPTGLPEIIERSARGSFSDPVTDPGLPEIVERSARGSFSDPVTDPGLPEIIERSAHGSFSDPVTDPGLSEIIERLAKGTFSDELLDPDTNLVLPRIVEPNDLPTTFEASIPLHSEYRSMSSPPVISVPSPLSLTIPTITTDLMLDDLDISPCCMLGTSLSEGISSSQPMALLTVPGFSPSCYSSSDGESSACSTPGFLTPGGMLSPCLFTPDGCRSPLFDREMRCLSPTPSTRSLKLDNKESRIRQISKLSTLSPVSCLLSATRDRSPLKDRTLSFPLLNMPLLQTLPCQSSLGGVSGMGGFIGKVLMANADALCAAATPLVENDEINIDEFEEKCVMNNYFGIGLDAKIALDFHQKREEHPEKCRSRTKNLMWFGVLGGKEILARTYKNLEQRVQLECDGRRIPLPNLQGIVVLNIPSYMGGTNFWGGTKEDDNFIATSFDDNILEVVAVFGSVQLGISRVINLQRHRIAQCRTVKITVTGDEGVPVQVDGEAWVQPPGVVYITHKNRAQMLTRDKIFEEALKTWLERQKFEKSISLRYHNVLSEEESVLLLDFVEATEALIRSVKLASICHRFVEQELLHLATQASGFLDRLYPDGRLSRPACRIQVSDLVSSVHSLYNETRLFMSEKSNTMELRADIIEVILAALMSMDIAMKRVYEIGGLPHFQTLEEQAACESEQKKMSKEKSKRRWAFIRGNHSSTRKEKASKNTPHTPAQTADVRLLVRNWSTDEVRQWLHSLDLDEHKAAFVAHDIRGRELLALSRTDLKELGVTKVGHVKRIQQAIKELKKYSDKQLKY